MRQTAINARLPGWLALCLAGLLSACGGGGGGGSPAATAAPQAPVPTPAPPAASAPVLVDDGSSAKPATREQAYRFLMQASFGPTPADIDRVMALGYAAWIDEQWAAPQSSHVANWDAADAQLKQQNSQEHGGVLDVVGSFYKVAVTGPDQLRQRVAYGLSQIFVVSTANDSVSFESRNAAAYLDLLATHAGGSYRALLEGVALSPAMGMYLSHIRNQKEDYALGRSPDENFAREVMQLFTIGMVQLQSDGTPLLVNQQTQPTFTAQDITDLAKVFTGWSWSAPQTTEGWFWGWCPEFCMAGRETQPMQAYAQYHSTSEKRFLGVTIEAQTSPNPLRSLSVALDTLAAHPNVAPFLARQLIQRMVKSHPSPAYVGRVAQALGPQGDLKSMVKAVLLDPEARDMRQAALPESGKLQEPVLRMAHALRTLGASSDSGQWLVGLTDDPSQELGQTPLRAPAVFNFYRPGFVAPGTLTGQRGLTMPEFELVNETSVAGYAQYMLDGVANGFGMYGRLWKAPRRDIQLPLEADLPWADQPDALVERITARLLGGRVNAALRQELQDAVATVAVEPLKADGSNRSAVQQQQLNRVRLAIFLTLASPEYAVLK
ncbi:DUF1800 family protein [Roseateles sp. BYS180W]|uniref:DUF1800 family protein n=1 Tax=Roseateles rivi TaxID=3299028 RepID=A0ABW7FQY6_9BURK